ncbi:hypothetical protein GCM10028785_13010 [Hydrogenophaga soli]
MKVALPLESVVNAVEETVLPSVDDTVNAAPPIAVPAESLAYTVYVEAPEPDTREVLPLNVSVVP